MNAKLYQNPKATDLMKALLLAAPYLLFWSAKFATAEAWRARR